MTKFKLFVTYQKYILPYLRKGGLSLITSTIALLLGMALPLITKALIDYAYPNKDLFLLTLLISGTIVIFFTRQYFNSISSYLDMFTENDLSVKLKAKFYDKLQQLSLKFHSEKQSGDLMFRMDEDISTVTSMIIQFIATSLQTLFQLGFLLLICVRFDWRLTLLALSGIPLYFIETKFFAKRREHIVKQELEKGSAIRSHLQERIPAIKMIKAFSREKLESSLFKKKIKEVFLITRESHIVVFLNVFTDSTIRTIWLAILGWYAGYHVITGVLSIGELIAITVYVTQIYGPVMNLGEIYKFIIEGMVSVERVDEVLSRKPMIEDLPDAKDLKNIKGNISFKDVSFSYSPDKLILQSINLDIEAKKAVALIGPSGVGKTTFTDLITRFYDPDRGKVLIDGEDVKKVTQASLRENVAIVNQEVTIFKGAIKENIKYGNENVGFEDIVEAAKLANAHEFIEKLPSGYDTMLQERGLNLSGGQRQRITIARALIRNPKILILDEATSAIDPESEAYIHGAMMRFKQGRTVITIAHKLSTIIDADEIMFFEKGKVLERGNFNELMAQKERFYKFFEIEFGNFRHFSECLIQEMLRTKRYKRPFSLMVIELRNLGKISSEIGEEKLNAALFEIEEVIRKSIREVDFSTKYQKDRFLIGLPETDFKATSLATKRIEKTIIQHVYLKEDQDVRFIPEIGISSMGEDADTITDLYRNSEKMLEEKLTRT